jgi:CENP-B N-terminal DNA-binding domain
MPKETKTRKRHPLTVETKKKICQYYIAHPNVKHKELADHFGLKNTRSTLSKILAKKEKWLREDTSGAEGKKMKQREVA